MLNSDSTSDCIMFHLNALAALRRFHLITVLVAVAKTQQQFDRLVKSPGLVFGRIRCTVQLGMLLVTQREEELCRADVHVFKHATALSQLFPRAAATLTCKSYFNYRHLSELGTIANCLRGVFIMSFFLFP